MALYLNPNGEMGNPINLPQYQTPGVYRNVGLSSADGVMGNPVNSPQNTGGPSQLSTPGAAPQKGWLDKLYDNYTSSWNEAHANNEKYFGATAGLYGYDANGKPLNPNVAYDPSVSALAGLNSNGQWNPGSLGPSLAPPTWSGVSPNAKAVDAEMAKRGVFNSGSAVLNKFNTNTMDKFNADMATQQGNLNLFNTQQQVNQLNQNRLERNRDSAAAIFASREDQYADPSMLAQIAQQTGSGTTEGLIPGMFGAGGGGGFIGAGDLGYGVPQFYDHSIDYSRGPKKAAGSGGGAIQPRSLVNPGPQPFKTVGGPKAGFPVPYEPQQPVLPSITMPTLSTPGFSRPPLNVPQVNNTAGSSGPVWWGGGMSPEQRAASPYGLDSAYGMDWTPPPYAMDYEQQPGLYASY